MPKVKTIKKLVNDPDRSEARVVLFGPDNSRLGRARIQRIVDDWFDSKQPKAKKTGRKAS